MTEEARAAPWRGNVMHVHMTNALLGMQQTSQYNIGPGRSQNRRNTVVPLAHHCLRNARPLGVHPPIEYLVSHGRAGVATRAVPTISSSICEMADIAGCQSPRDTVTSSRSGEVLKLLPTQFCYSGCRYSGHLAYLQQVNRLTTRRPQPPCTFAHETHACNRCRTCNAHSFDKRYSIVVSENETETRSTPSAHDQLGQFEYDFCREGAPRGPLPVVSLPPLTKTYEGGGWEKR